MSRTTRSGARVSPPPKASSGTRVVRGNKSKALAGPSRRPTRKSNRSTSHSSRKKKAPVLETDPVEVDSQSEDDLPDDEDIYKELESEDEESDTADDSDNEVIEALARRQPKSKKHTRTGRSNARRVPLDESHDASLANAEDDPDDFTRRLEAQFAKSPTNRLENLDVDDEVHDNSVLPTVENYKGLVKEWTRKRITSVQDLQKKVTSVPPHILTEAKAIKKLYKHHKRMLAMMGNITTYTLDKALGELGGTRFPDAYRLWLKFSIEARKLKMPRKYQAGKALGQRNRKLGAAWKALSVNQKRVFHPRVFYTLSGLPAPTSDFDTDDEENGPTDLSPDELPKYNQLSLKCVEKLHNQQVQFSFSCFLPYKIENEANRMDFGYYFLASSTHPATGGDSADPGWCKEFTSNEELADYVRMKSNFPTIFAAQTQGISVDKVIASAIGKTEKMKMNCKRVDPGDKVKSDLAALLKSDLVLKFVPPGFPRGPDPGKLLLDKGWKVKIKQLPGSSLPPEVLKLGFNAMNSRRSLWLNDLQAGLFRFEKIPEDEDDDLDYMVTDHQEEPLEKDEELTVGIEEELEWNGIGEDETYEA
ncbi:uncharacterized protein MELLADRAFT_84646 [Melampsora larici-populina 98AG31]|uniref:Uncharacterized protein n=1 Tax=Melampsora larici-populina (strain 98AG31 / pathotype 3-4-7) TaxID=747676 RepID=F4RG08_MELLP|nr:uncharacterized protein MELLADRAFT_84646 [Melampsora larici-populina 98AG31]EGG08468.1 hypothetical protein MELLADRAFT_84646 [Melampsora larici-populina 98AG31]